MRGIAAPARHAVVRAFQFGPVSVDGRWLPQLIHDFDLRRFATGKHKRIAKVLAEPINSGLVGNRSAKFSHG